MTEGYATPLVDFGSRLATSESFVTLFREGMSLVEETALYLDGPGREESRILERATTLLYATESMRLTTRLMQLASWLLLQRAVNAGELSAEQAGQDRHRVRIQSMTIPDLGIGFEELPQGLQELVTRSMRMLERVQHLDQALYGIDGEKAAPASNAVADRMSQLTAAFGAQ